MRGEVERGAQGLLTWVAEEERRGADLQSHPPGLQSFWEVKTHSQHSWKEEEEEFLEEKLQTPKLHLDDGWVDDG